MQSHGVLDCQINAIDLQLRIKIKKTTLIKLFLVSIIQSVLYAIIAIRIAFTLHNAKS